MKTTDWLRCPQMYLYPEMYNDEREKPLSRIFRAYYNPQGFSHGVLRSSRKIKRTRLADLIEDKICAGILAIDVLCLSFRLLLSSKTDLQMGIKDGLIR